MLRKWEGGLQGESKDSRLSEHNNKWINKLMEENKDGFISSEEAEVKNTEQSVSASSQSLYTYVRCQLAPHMQLATVLLIAIITEK